MIANSTIASLLTAAFCVFLAGSAVAQGTYALKSVSRARSEVGVAAIGEKIYVVGGSVYDVGGKKMEQYASTTLQEYDPSTNTWRDLAPLPQGLSHPGAASLNGKLYVAGGFTIFPAPDAPGGGHLGAVNSFYVYEPATNRWQTLAPFSSRRGSVGVVAVAGKIHAIGGRGLDQQSVGTHDVYDLATGKWTLAAPLPTARDHMGIAVLNGRIHVVSGRDSLDANVAAHDIFDPATGKWTSAAAPPTARSSGAAVAYRGLLIYAAGECKDFPTETAFDENEAFDPKTGKWTTLARLPNARHGFGAVSIGDSLYFLGGTHGCGGARPAKDILVFKLP